MDNNADNLKKLKELHGDNLIVKNNLVVGVCSCKGQGKENCRGNGWQNFFKVNDDGNDTYEYKSCPHMTKVNPEA
jgi:hypothetical protein